MVTRIDVHLQSGDVSIYWLWLLLDISESFSLSPDYCIGIRHRSSWKLYSKFSLCFRTTTFCFSYTYFSHRCGSGGTMRVCHAAGPGSIPGRDKFPGWGFFWGFSSLVRQMSGRFRPPKVSKYHLAIIFIHNHSLRTPMTWDVDAPWNLKYTYIYIYIYTYTYCECTHVHTMRIPI